MKGWREKEFSLQTSLIFFCQLRFGRNGGMGPPLGEAKILIGHEN